MKIRTIVLLVCGLWTLPACAGVVTLTTGKVSGTSAQGIEAFKGIPYAAAPVGERRWQPPAPVEPWKDVRKADTFGLACPQDTSRRGPAAPELKTGEDCLWLNVWRPTDGKKHPVVMWIFGGGFVAGDSSNPVNDGAELAKRGIVVVTINHRFGALGYMAHPSLSGRSPNHISGNYGLLDQVAALQWIQANIAAFGGDPKRVTIAGQSSGGISVNALMTTPLARGLFHGAIVMSAPITGLTPPLPEMEDAEAFGAAYTSVRNANTAAELLALKPEQLTAMSPPEAALASPFRPLVDAHVLPNHPLRLFAAGSQAKVPFIIGSTAHESARITPMNPTPEEFEAWVLRSYPAQAGMILAAYDYKTPANTRAAWLAVKSDDMFSGNRREARFHQRSGAPAYLFRFDREPPGTDRARMRSFHGADVPYAFGTLNTQQRPWEDADRKLSQTLMTYWANFIHTGNPNGPGVPTWEAYDPARDMELALDAETRMVKVADPAKLAIYEVPTIR